MFWNQQKGTVLNTIASPREIWHLKTGDLITETKGDSKCQEKPVAVGLILWLLSCCLWSAARRGVFCRPWFFPQSTQPGRTTLSTSSEDATCASFSNAVWKQQQRETVRVLDWQVNLLPPSFPHPDAATQVGRVKYIFRPNPKLSRQTLSKAKSSFAACLLLTVEFQCTACPSCLK